MKIDNMRLEHQEKLFKLSEKEAAQKKAEEEKACLLYTSENGKVA